MKYRFSNAGNAAAVLSHRIRTHALEMTSRGGSSHIGSIFSVADIIGTLYARVLNYDPTNPKLPERDRLILSKGHAGASVYAALAECGFFPTERLKEHYQNGSIFSGHVSHKGVPGVEFSTGSLGHGLGIATGMALAAKRGNLGWRSFVVMSDGECDEGSIWEAAMFAAHHKLSNLVAVIDYNKIQSLTKVSDTLALEPFADKWRAFGWAVVEVDGHDHAALESAMTDKTLAVEKPRVVIAHTVKGKGVSFMEHSVLWHYRTARDTELAAARVELENINPEPKHA
jgi:transketolase